MTVDTTATSRRISRLPGEREFRHFAAGLGLAYAAATLTLLAKLLIFPGTQHWMVAPAPAISGATGTAGDLTAPRADWPPVSSHRPGSVEFEPPPAGPRLASGFSHASTTQQANETAKPAIGLPGHVIAHAQSSSLAGE